jgi:ribosome-associated translation inhibitor RaiA
MNSKMKFGVYLEDGQYQFIKNKMALLEETAPHNSKIDLQMSMPFNKVKGFLSIRSYGHVFKAEAKDDNPVNLYLKLEEQIKNQLNNWKAKRFLDLKSQELTPKNF